MIPLEIWDLEVGGATLFEARGAPDFGARLAAAVRAIQAGEARLRSGAVLPPACRAIDAIFAGGGDLDAVRAALGALPIALHAADPPAFVGEPGGLDLLDSIGARAGLVADVGQTSIKISHRRGRARFARDLDRLPIDAPDTTSAREGFRGFLAEILARAAREAGDVDAVILALPAELDDAGRPGPSSYPGLEGDTDLAAEVLGRARLRKARCLLLNDAELAALSARRAVPPGATALVLTVGHGVGGALLLPR